MNGQKQNPLRRFFRSAEIASLKEEIRQRDAEIEALRASLLALREEYASGRDLAREHFLANVSHEIRTPIHAIIGYAELALSSGKLPSALEEDMDKLMSASEMLLDIVNNLLDITKLSGGQFVVREGAYDLKQLLAEACGSIRPRIKPEITFEMQCDKSVPDWLIGDRLLLKQVLLNLLSNAAKYTERGSIRLGVHYREGNLVFEVEDSGIGIKECDYERIFEKFERVFTETDQQIEGTGIGLSIVRDVLSRMNGTISVRSVYGVGSTFTAVIPQAPSEYGVYSSSSQPQIAFSDGVRVLLVDDNEVNLRVMERLLGHFGLSVDTASGGEAALTLIAQNRYTLCFLDHMMPVMDGIETLKRIRAYEKTLGDADGSSPLPVVALTANAMQGMREFFLEQGFNDYLSKPVTLERLVEALKTWIPQSGFLSETAGDEFNDRSVRALIDECEYLDTQLGLEYAGSYEMLSTAIATFALSIDEKSAVISESLESGDDQRYLVEVHGLKSAAKIIGATELSEQAAYLEDCARNKETDEIAYFTPRFLELLLWYKEKLAPIAMHEKAMSGDLGTPHTPPADALAMRQELQVLRHLAEVYDLDNIDAWATKIAATPLPEAWRPHLRSVLDAIRVIDYERIIASVDRATAEIS